MPSKEFVFIHHSQRDGRLSQDNAKKVWGHVSRRSWQKRPKEMTITMWKPPRRLSDRDGSHPPSDREALVIPYSKLQQAYLSNKGLKHLRPPEGLAILERTLSIVGEHGVKGYILQQSGVYELFEGNNQLINWSFSIHCGCTNLQNHNFSQAFASFEFASRILNTCLTAKHPHVFSHILKALGDAQCRNAHDVVQLFLKQIAALATTSFGPRHPFSVWARNILVMGINPALTEKLYMAEMNAVCSAGFTSRERVENGLFQLKCDCLGTGYHLHEAEQNYRDLVDRTSTLSEFPGLENRRYQYQVLSVNMAELYLQHQSFSKAASVLSDAPADLEEFISKGWAPTFPATAPLSMIMIIRRLYVLGQALAAQGDHEPADAAFKLAVSAGLKYLDPEHHICISAQKAYSEYLSSQNRKEEADEIEQIVDLRLDMYKLTLSNDE